MNWAWPTSFDEIWRSPTFPMWLTLAAAGFFALILLITLLRAEKSVANGALTVITLLAIGVAGAATIRGFGPGGAAPQRDSQPPQSMIAAAPPALSCIDDLAGETVLNACEKVLFGSADAVAAAVSYAASRITLLTAYGDVATANKNMTPELQILRRSVERDRYGLIAYVLSARDRCQPGECSAYRSLTDHNQVAANMDERVYEGLILRYSPAWNAPAVPAAPAATGAVAALPPSLPTGKPTNAEFPSAASTPPVSIMTPEPAPPTAASAPRPAPAATAAPGAPTAAPRPALASTAAKKQPAPKSRPAAPVQLSPAPGAPTPAAPAPAAAND
jgi:hypothetical protein